MYPLHCSQSLGLYHLFIRATSAFGWLGITQLGTLGTLDCFIFSHSSLHKALSHFLHKKSHHGITARFSGTQASTPHKNTSKQWLPSSIPWLVLFPALCSSFVAQNFHVKTVRILRTNFIFFLAFLTHTLLKDDCNSSHALQ